jgi:hypothetical protein
LVRAHGVTSVAQRQRALVAPLAAAIGHDLADRLLVQKQKELTARDGDAAKSKLARAFGCVLKIDRVQPERGLRRARRGFALSGRSSPIGRAIACACKRRAEPKCQKPERKRHDTDTIALHSVFLSLQCYAQPKAKKRQTAPD